ncbi:MAG: phosphoglucosamine mutase [Eggerthellaceae bacterium]|nr:phosphoglucosamine mutase [Eggerthellaceae bacterium]
MARMFGTDGVRGIANVDITNELAYRLGQAAVHFLGTTIALGRDTRLSGEMLQSAIASGIMSVGGTVLTLDIIPTPGVALLTRTLSADGGIVISASHNPPEYNGIKFFDRNGFKLPDNIEDEIQDFVEAGGFEAYCAQNKTSMPQGDAVGMTVPVEDACERYIAQVVSSVKEQGVDFSGLHIALDTGHGASSLTSASAFEQLGANVTVINDDFDGTDINVECGSTHLAPLHELMKETGADIGVAHDGDADRVMLVAPDGFEIDGDFVNAFLALDMKARNVLAKDTVVSTVMCNLGFVHAMKAHGIDVVQTAVGDRYVLEAMREHGYVLGGEQSGHTILLNYNTTGDGLMTACQYIAAMRRQGKTANEAVSIMTRLPQALINVSATKKSEVDTNEEVRLAIDEASRQLGDEGRILVRASGTEPLVRVMVEAISEDIAQKYAKTLAGVVEEALN